MGSLVVIGLSGRGPADDWAALVAGRVVLARRRQSAIDALPPGMSIERSFDTEFESPDPEQAVEAATATILERARSADVAYLTPGLASIGDAVVAVLRQNVTPVVHAGTLPDIQGAPTTLTIVDALVLAVAQAAEPFSAGQPPLDPTAPLLVTNWYPGTVADLAQQRLDRIYGPAHSDATTRGEMLYVPAIDRLAGSGSFAALAHIVARLRRPDGCPWDREQTMHSLLPALAEEADELREAIEANDVENIAEEMGDVLVNLLMQAQIATEAGLFRFDDAIAAASSKLVRRHPHVFANRSATNPDEVLEIWQQVKAAEKQAAARRTGRA